MTVFIDSNIVIALLNSRDKHHDRAKLLLTELKKPEYGMRVTTDYVLDEVLTTLWLHTHRKNIVTKEGEKYCSESHNQYNARLPSSPTYDNPGV